MTPAGFEPATFRFVAQQLNHCATAVYSDIYGWYRSVDLFWSDCLKALNPITVSVYIFLTFVIVLYYVTNPIKTCPFIEVSVTCGQITILLYLLTAIELTPGGNSTIHIYSQTMHRTTQLTFWRRNNFFNFSTHCI